MKRQIIALLVSLCLVITFVPISDAHAFIISSGKLGDHVEYTLSDDGTLTVSGYGDIYNYRIWDDSPIWGNKLVKKIIVKPGITSIGNYAFCGLQNLTSVTLPEGVKRIGHYAFNGAFVLESIIMPTTVTSIGNSAFDYCYKLKSIYLPDGLKTIGDEAFKCCKTISSLLIPSTVTSIGTNAFSYCVNLKKVTIEGNINKIPEKCFLCCSKLSQVSLPDSLQLIDVKAFSYCKSLKTINIEKGLDMVSVDDNAFINSFRIPKYTKISPQTRSIELKWAKDSAAAGYEIKYSKNLSMDNAKTVRITSNSTTSKTLKSLSRNRNYYVQIREYRNFGGVKFYSVWSKIRVIRTK